MIPEILLILYTGASNTDPTGQGICASRTYWRLWLHNHRRMHDIFQLQQGHRGILHMSGEHVQGLSVASSSQCEVTWVQDPARGKYCSSAMTTLGGKKRVSPASLVVAALQCLARQLHGRSALQVKS